MFCFFYSANALLLSRFSLVLVWHFRWPSGGGATLAQGQSYSKIRSFVTVAMKTGGGLVPCWNTSEVSVQKKKNSPTHLFFDGRKSCWLWTGKFRHSFKRLKKKESQLKAPEAGKSCCFCDVSKHARISHLTRRLQPLFALEMNLRSSFKTVKCPFFSSEGQSMPLKNRS